MTLRGAASRAAVPVAAAAVAAVLVVAGHLGLRDERDDRVAGPGSSGSAMTDPTVNPFGTPAAALSGPVTRLRVPAIGVDTALEPLRLGADGELVPPHDFGRAGWYAGGTAPGDVGPAVIAGHVDSRSGPAVFFKLREVGTGDTIEVTRGRTTVRFTVVLLPN